MAIPVGIKTRCIGAISSTPSNVGIKIHACRSFVIYDGSANAAAVLGRTRLISIR